MRAHDHAAVTAPAPRRPFGKYRVGLVCLGNICRSPMAEVVLRAELERAGLSGRVEVDSAGTGDWHVGDPMDRGARAELSRRGYDGAGHRARQFDPSWFDRYDLLVTPTLLILPPTLDRAHELLEGRCTLPVNLAGVPALALPVPAHGPLPASIQLVSAPGTEERLLAAGAALEAAVAA